MGDVYIEQLVQKTPSAKDKAMRVLIIAAFVFICAVALLLVLVGYAIALLLVLAGGFFMLYMLTFYNIEYEYTITHGELDIDIIYGKSRRKRLFNGEIKTFEIMCHVSDDSHEHTFNRAQTYLDYSGGIIAENTYKFYCVNKGRQLAIAFEPNAEILAAVKIYMGSSKFKPLST